MGTARQRWAFLHDPHRNGERRRENVERPLEDCAKMDPPRARREPSRFFGPGNIVAWLRELRKTQ